MLGARSDNPNATLRRRLVLRLVVPWQGEGRRRGAGRAGADVISGSPNTPVQGLAAEEKGVWAIGSTGDFSAYVKKAQRTPSELDLSAAHIEAAKAMKNKWQPSTRWRGLGPGGFVKMTTNSPEPPANVAAAMKAAEAAYRLRQAQPFAGPIKDENGRPEGGGRRERSPTTSSRASLAGRRRARQAAEREPHRYARNLAARVVRPGSR